MTTEICCPVRFLHYPESASVTFSAVKGDVGDIGVGSSFYDTFGGDIAEADMNRIYVCPIASNYVPRTTMTYGNATYSPNIHIVEPQEVITRGVDWVDDHAAGVVGIGGCSDMYEEVFVIDDDGASTVSKFGHRLLRLPTGEIFLDGEEQECK